MDPQLHVCQTDIYAHNGKQNLNRLETNSEGLVKVRIWDAIRNCRGLQLWPNDNDYSVFQK